MNASLQVVYVDPGSTGYHCMYYMAQLAANLLGGKLVILHPNDVSALRKAMAALPRRCDGFDCLFICPSPSFLTRIAQITDWRRKYRTIVAWVFDSFWTEHIPRFARWGRVFDQVFVTEAEDLSTWRSSMSVPVEWLPWGSDVLSLGSDNAERAFDLLRFGRQPVSWDDDESTEQQCKARGLSFHGRPVMQQEAFANQVSLMNTLQNTKFALAFSNLVSPNPQTHPKREYITGRWTDALACGAIVAGVPPRTGSVASLLWPEALLDLGTTNHHEGLEIVTDAARDWKPARAKQNFFYALERLDWRWRFKCLAEALCIESDQLSGELKEIETRLAAGRASEAVVPFPRVCTHG